MGKVKQNKKKKNRHKPTGMISVQEAEEREAGEGSSGLEDKTLPILEKVTCAVQYFLCQNLLFVVFLKVNDIHSNNVNKLLEIVTSIN
jgi:hypothetical protein